MGTTVPLFIKTPKNVFRYFVTQYDKNSAYTMSFNVSEATEWASQYKNIQNKVESQLFEKMTTGPIEGEGKQVHGRLKMWKKRIKTTFHGQYIPYDMYCNATAALKIDSVYKQGKKYHPQVYVEQYKYTNAKNQQCNMMSKDDDDDDDDGFFDV